MLSDNSIKRANRADCPLSRARKRSKETISSLSSVCFVKRTSVNAVSSVLLFLTQKSMLLVMRFAVLCTCCEPGCPAAYSDTPPQSHTAAASRDFP
eukprot:969665-Pleurochrysis_carterae.AAC.4